MHRQWGRVALARMRQTEPALPAGSLQAVNGGHSVPGPYNLCRYDQSEPPAAQKQHRAQVPSRTQPPLTRKLHACSASLWQDFYSARAVTNTAMESAWGS